MLAVHETVGVLHRGDVLVAAVRDLRGHFAPTNRGLSVSFTGTLVGRRSWWCEPGVEVGLTFLASPRRKRSARLYLPAVEISEIDGDAVRLSGSTPLSNEPGWAGDISTEYPK